MARLDGKVAIITGASNGMGADEAQLFAREGAKVILADRAATEGQAQEATIRANGGDALFVQTDVTNEADWEAVVRTAVSRYGKLDILVNNAGLSSTLVDDPMSTEGWHRIMDVNINGVFFGTKHAIPAMQQAGGGSIVNISSIMGFVGGETGHPAYHASKGAVRIFTKATAVKYGPDNIRANSVHPGFMPPMTTSRPDPEAREQQVAWTPLRRIGKTMEVAYGVLFLASDEASFITGTELVIDGGFLAR
jgi:NAD(P)-dependent dehydrogenase (short-subunit alcohol dehydrogenase family)